MPSGDANASANTTCHPPVGTGNYDQLMDQARKVADSNCAKAMELYAKAALVDRETLVRHQQNSALVDAENCLKDAFATDVRPALQEWRRSRGLPEDPLEAFRASGYLERITKERAEKHRASASSYA